MDDFSELTGAALVTGGSGGIGRAVVRLLAQRGSDVALTWRHGRGRCEGLADEVASYGGRVSMHQLDSGRPGRLRAVVAEVVERHGGCTRWSTRPARTCRWCT